MSGDTCANCLLHVHVAGAGLLSEEAMVTDARSSSYSECLCVAIRRNIPDNVLKFGIYYTTVERFFGNFHNGNIPMYVLIGLVGLPTRVATKLKYIRSLPCKTCWQTCQPSYPFRSIFLTYFPFYPCG